MLSYAHLVHEFLVYPRNIFFSTRSFFKNQPGQLSCLKYVFSLGYYENYYLELIYKYGEKSKCDAFMWGKELREKYHTLFKLLQEMDFSAPDGNHILFYCS